ncbi:MAG: glycerol-3-phosphate dehydrogenase/oxidase [Acidobacteria bacterium]|nr:glycerol-3-phosphate dehydrogenase/oxidase [Acidobacteriota bacterium]
MTDLSLLGPAQRETALTRMADEQFDLAIIGGGSTGMGAALDAASRGLSVALIEQRDIASGTSSRSSKLIHGGLRYLERLDFRLVREALTERDLLLTKLAPHLVYPVPFIFPFRHRLWERAYVAAGVAVYDALAASTTNPLPRQRQLSRRSMLEAFPALDATAFVGGLRYYDAGTDDARFVVALARTATREGAAIATSTRAVGLPRRGDRVTGIAGVDLESGREVTIRADVVINATGVWTDDVEQLVDDPVPDVTASKRVHLVVRRDRIDSSMGLITKTKKSVLFIIPFGEFWLIGTTDTAWTLDLAHPAASTGDIDYLLGQVNRLLADPLTREDVVGVYAGLRPLVTGSQGATSQLSREHAITHPAPGMVTIAGGKVLVWINVDGDVGIDVLRCWMGQDSTETNEQQRVDLITQVTVFPTVTSVEPAPHLFGAPSKIDGATNGAAGKCGIDSTNDGAGAQTLILADSFNNLLGWLWVATPEERIIIRAGGASGFGMKLATVPTTKTGWSFGVTYREI